MMAGILSHAEIDALLTALPATNDAGDSEHPGIARVTPYDFSRPDRVSKDQIRSLQVLHDRFARNMTNSLAAYLRTSVEVAVATVEQFSYAEFLMSLPDPTAFYGIRIRHFDGLGALELNPSLAFTIVDRMLGGTARGAVPDRAMTEIEQTVVDSVVTLVLEHLTETWRPVRDTHFSIEGRETRPQMLPVAGRNEIMILIAFDVRVSEARGMLHVCIPAAAVESAGLGFSHGWQSAVPSPTPVQRAHLVENLGRIPFQVTAMLSTTLGTREVLALAEGDLLSLGVPIAVPLNISVGDVVKFNGRLTVRHDRVGVIVEGVPTPTRPEPD